MSALRSSLQKQLFGPEDERLAALVTVSKQEGRKKQRPTFLCVSVTLDHPITVRLWTVKAEKDDVFRRKPLCFLRDVRMVDGVNPRKALPDFSLVFQSEDGEETMRITAASSEEKDVFIRQIYKLSTKYLPVQMPDFSNVSLPVDEPSHATRHGGASADQRDLSAATADTSTIFSAAHTIDYQPISAKEEADFRKLLARFDLRITDAEEFAAKLTDELHRLDTANMESMMGSERAVNDLVALIDAALLRVNDLEDSIDKTEEKLSKVRDSIELWDEKDSLAQVERKNKQRLQVELSEFVNQLDLFSDSHFTALQDARLSDAASIARCAEAARAASAFAQAKISRPLKQLRAYRERQERLGVVDLFIDRFMSHLSALFNNLGDLSDSQDWHQLSLPKHSQRHRALLPLAELIGWLKSTRPNVYQASIQKYVDSTQQLYRRHFQRFFAAVEAELHHRTATATIGGLTGGKEYHTLIETVLGELSPVIEMEQRFCSRFFHISVDSSIQHQVAAPIDVLSTASSSDSGGAAAAAANAVKSAERNINEQLRQILAPLFDSLGSHLDSFVKGCCRQDPSTILMLFVVISKRVLAANDAASYFAVTFGTLVVLIKRQFDAYMDFECTQIMDVRLSKKARIGLLANIDRLSEVVRRAETYFQGMERRTDLEKWYQMFYRAAREAIARAASSPFSKSPPTVVAFENLHKLHGTLSELRLGCFDAQRKETKKDMQEAMNEYVKEQLGKPLEKLTIFFDEVQRRIEQGVRPEEISYQPQFGRIELKKAISAYPGKEVKKGLEQLYRKVEKHLADGSPLLQVVWRNMQDEFLKELKHCQQLMATCYPGTRAELEFTIQDVLTYFSDIAQQH